MELIDSGGKRHSRQGESKYKSPKERTHLACSSDNEKTSGLEHHKEEEGDQILGQRDARDMIMQSLWNIRRTWDFILNGTGTQWRIWRQRQLAFY